MILYNDFCICIYTHLIYCNHFYEASGEDQLFFFGPELRKLVFKFELFGRYNTRECLCHGICTLKVQCTFGECHGIDGLSMRVPIWPVSTGIWRNFRLIGHVVSFMSSWSSLFKSPDGHCFWGDPRHGRVSLELWGRDAGRSVRKTSGCKRSSLSNAAFSCCKMIFFSWTKTAVELAEWRLLMDLRSSCPTSHFFGAVLHLAGAYHVPTLPRKVAAGNQRSGCTTPRPGNMSQVQKTKGNIWFHSKGPLSCSKRQFFGAPTRMRCAPTRIFLSFEGTCKLLIYGCTGTNTSAGADAEEVQEHARGSDLKGHSTSNATCPGKFGQTLMWH